MRKQRKSTPTGLARGAEKELVIAGVPFALAVAAAAAWPGLATILPAVVLAGLFGLLLYFFRDPERSPPTGKDIFVSPADGKVVKIGPAHEPHFVQGEALKISIFMSILDVHVNRAPAEGTVALVQHVPGQFLQAFRAEASEVNEHNLIGLETRYGRVLVNQVAGIMARRIVCWVQPGEELQRGERLGVIKFGSRVDLYLPVGAEPAVAIGAQVHAGRTVIAAWKRAVP